MTWTYSGDPSTTSRDAVRYRSGLTDKDDQLVSDEEIAYVLAESAGDVVTATVSILDALAVRFSGMRRPGERRP